MNKRIFITLLAALAVCLSCQQKPKPIPDYQWKPGGQPEPIPSSDLYEFEKEHKAITAPSDMVLMYGGGHHRSPYYWTEDYAKDYVTYTDKDNQDHYLFDGFLFLEFMDGGDGGSNKTFITGYQYNGQYLLSAHKQEWEKLADYYFNDETGLDAVEAAVKKAAAKIGNPPSKRKIVIGIPEPIKYENSHASSGGTTYWGSIDGKTLDFSVTEDRLKAVVWYIDRIRKNFAAKDYEYIDLTGFYWVAEKATQTADLMPLIAQYLNGINYSFNWIPYFNADGSTRWKDYGFNYAYLQPNYFFNSDIPYQRLLDACKVAKQFGMQMEMEFDGNAMSGNAGNGYRLRDYMQAFRDEGIWETRKLAYYQGSYALRWLKYSKYEEDRELYHDFCNFVITRPVRESAK